MNDKYFYDARDLEGKVFTSVRRGETSDYNDAIFFENEEEKFVLAHRQDCCESVNIEDIAGDLEDLVGVPIEYASEDENSGDEGYNSYTYTYYRFRTIKGTVSLRFYGTSNGYYSESVDLVKER